MALIAGLATINTLALPAAAEQWVRIETFRNGLVAYLDKGSIEQRGNDRLFWLYISSPRPLATYRSRVVYNLGMQLSMNCRSKKLYAPHFVRLMDENNQPLAQREASASLKRRLATSPKDIATFSKLVCNR